MAFFGDFVLYAVLFCAFCGALAYIRNKESPLGKEFLEGLYSIGPVFVPVAGIMASTPYLAEFVKFIFGPAFAFVGADPAIAATSFIAVDMGGYQLAGTLAQSPESWIMAVVIGYMAGATIVFSIPVGLAMIDRSDHRYIALGTMCGLLAIPVGVFVTCLILSLTHPEIRLNLNAGSASTHTLALSIGRIFSNLAPLLIFVIALAAGLWRFPELMIKGFMAFGRFVDSATKLILVASIAEHFTQVFSRLLGGWGFNPVIADARDPFRALEVAGNISFMLCGAFPMVYLLKKHLALPLESVGKRFGLDGAGAAGLIATIANILAMYRLVPEMRPPDKVLNIAFAVCAAFLLGDHLAFTVNFQPSLILPVMAGKISGGVFALLLARRLVRRKQLI